MPKRNDDDPIEIDLWLWPLQRRGAAEQTLSDEERARAARFVMEKHRDLYIAGRARLRRVLARYIGRRADAVPLRVAPEGKPELEGLPFNLSHTGALAALAVVRGGGRWRIGVDIEAIRPTKDGLADYAFSEAERAALAALPANSAQDAAFFAGWTRKEAYLKAIGSGLLAPLDAFDVDLAPDAAEPSIEIRDAREAGAGWRLFSFQAAPNTPGALAIDAGAAPVTIRFRRIFGAAPASSGARFTP